MKRTTFLTASLLATEFGTRPLKGDAASDTAEEAPAPYGRPSPHESDVVRRPRGVPSPALTPLAAQLGTITPNGLFFVRDHAGIPNLDPARHRLLVHGLVRKPLVFSLADIARFPSVSRNAFIECAGNTSPGWRGLGEGVQFSHGLLSNAQWTGVPLRLVLDEVGAEREGTWLIAESADGAGYDRSLPVAHLDDALLVYGQNGEMLRPEQGYPLRLIVPGFEGSAQVKWLRRIEIVRTPVYSREDTAQYATLDASGISHPFVFTMPVKSVVTLPAPEHPLPERGAYECRGFAWSGRAAIRQVEITTDGGASWSKATLDDARAAQTLARFTFPLRWDGSEMIVASRASDASGDVQPTFAALRAARGPDLRYHVNAIAAWRVRTDGRVESADVSAS